MKNRSIKKMICCFMALLLMCSSMIRPVQAAEEDIMLEHNLEQFFEDGLGKSLIDRDGFYHVDFVETLRSENEYASLLTLLDLIYNDVESKGGEPSEEKYQEVLMNIMKVYEMDNAANYDEQNKLDNNKHELEYVWDAIKIGSSMLDFEKLPEESAKNLKSVVNGMVSLTDNGYEIAKDIVHLKTLLKNYSQHTLFLSLIEEKAEGKLKDAAALLHNSIEQMFGIILDEMSKSLSEGIVNFTITGILDDNVLEIIESGLSPSNPDNQFLLNFLPKFKNAAPYISNVMSGYDIGKLAGNLIVKSEDSLNSYLEQKAIYDISVILEKELYYYENNYKNLFQNSVRETVENYVGYGNYLITCRYRGEYRFCSMFDDKGFASAWNNVVHNSYNLARENFVEKADWLIWMKEQLDALLQNTELVEVSDYFNDLDALVGDLVMEYTENIPHNISNESILSEKDGLIVEWQDRIFSITNNGCSYVKLFGFMLGDEFSSVNKQLLDEGWEECWHDAVEYQYCTFLDGKPYLLYLYVENNRISGWYINNWPEGEYVWQILNSMKKQQVEKFESWEKFVKGKEYQYFIDDVDLYGEEYALYDLNHDGKDELLLQMDDGGSFYFTWIFVNYKGTIKLVKEGNRYGYGQYRYSPAYNAVLVSPETRPSAMAGASPFYQLKEDKLVYQFAVGQDLGVNYYWDESGEREITQEERLAYFEDTVHFNWVPVQ